MVNLLLMYSFGRGFPEQSDHRGENVHCTTLCCRYKAASSRWLHRVGTDATRPPCDGEGLCMGGLFSVQGSDVLDAWTSRQRGPGHRSCSRVDPACCSHAWKQLTCLDVLTDDLYSGVEPTLGGFVQVSLAV